MRKRTMILSTALVIVLSGCVSQAVKDEVQAEVAIHDGYVRLIETGLQGRADRDKDNVPAADLAATPTSVRRLLFRALTAVYKGRAGFNEIAYSLDLGPDTTTLRMEPSVEIAAIGSSVAADDAAGH